jgi:hypothetical protein
MGRLPKRKKSMKTTVSLFDFQDAFLKSETYKNNFTIDGLNALFDYFEEYENSTGEDIDFDMVAICCEYSEYASAIEAVAYYNGAVGENKDFDDEDKEKAALAWLEDQTQVITFEKGVIVANF